MALAKAARDTVDLGRARRLLESIQWNYPPEDAIKDARRDVGSWRGPARCPCCYHEWNLKGEHLASCGLAAVLKRE